LKVPAPKNDDKRAMNVWTRNFGIQEHSIELNGGLTYCPGAQVAVLVARPEKALYFVPASQGYER
jgi:hypothetical protein